MTKKSILAFMTLLWTLNTLDAQESLLTETKPIKNAVYFSAGTSVLWHSTTAYYERRLNDNLFNKGYSSFVKAGVGYYLLWDWSPSYGGPYIIAQYGLLTGKKAHHFEASGGLSYIFSGDLNGFPPLSATFGYRYQKPRKKFIFRSGVSFPEAIYMGAGISF